MEEGEYFLLRNCMISTKAFGKSTITNKMSFDTCSIGESSARSFDGTTFEDAVYFSNTTIPKNSLSNCVFEKEVTFKGGPINSYGLNTTTFKDLVYFEDVNIGQAGLNAGVFAS
jgi:hypothetical protein